MTLGMIIFCGVDRQATQSLFSRVCEFYLCVERIGDCVVDYN